MPPPSKQRRFSASEMQEKGVVTRLPLSSSILVRDAWGAGWHVATVKVSTSFRMKKRGKVPPRLETLRLSQYISHTLGFRGWRKRKAGIRSQQCHIGPTNNGVGDFSMKGGDGDEHDCAGKCGEDV